MASIVFTLDDGSSLTTPLDADIITIGRSPDSIVQLPNPSVSSQHAIIKPREDGYYVQDLQSSNGTRVNGAVIEEALLQDGDRVAFGDIRAIFYANEVSTEPATILVPQPNFVAPLVKPAPPVTGIPHRGPAPRKARHYQGEQSAGCFTAFVLLVLFGGAFIVGLSLRHYKETNGGVLPNDLVGKIFSKVKIEVNSDEKK
jgi:hypothetical protein